jgi:hypothetical protein
MKNKTIKESVVNYLAKDMASFAIKKEELFDRITIRLDEEQFNYKEDESVWKQKRDLSPKICEVYFDDVWCCDLTELDRREEVVLKFFKGFLKGYELGKIRLNRFLTKLEEEKEEEEKKRTKQRKKEFIDKLPTSTPEEKLAKEIIKELDKEKNEKSALNKLAA